MSSRQRSNVVPLRPRSSSSGAKAPSVPSAPSVTEQAEWTIGQALAVICTGDLSEVEAAAGHSGAILALRLGDQEAQRMIAAGADPKQGFPVEPAYFRPAWQRLLQDAAREKSSVATGVWGSEALPRAIPQSLLARATPEYHLDGEDVLRVEGEVIRAVRFSSRWCMDTYLPKSRARRKTPAATNGPPPAKAHRRSAADETARLLMDKAKKEGIELEGLTYDAQLQAVAHLCPHGRELPGKRVWARIRNESGKKSV